MKYVMTRTYPVPLEGAFTYMMDFRNWPKWSGSKEVEKKGAKWEKKGDTVTYTYELFRPVTLTCEAELLEVRSNKLIKALFRIPGMADTETAYMFTPAGDKAFTLRIEIEELLPDEWYAKPLHYGLFHGPLLKSAVMRSLDGLDAVFAKGLPKQPKPRTRKTTRKAPAKTAKKTAA